MRPRFDQQLEELNLELIKMGSLCERGIRKAVDLLMEENTNASIKDVDIIEEEINQKERDIETLCMRLLLQQQPVASDIRSIEDDHRYGKNRRPGPGYREYGRVCESTGDCS